MKAARTKKEHLQRNLTGVFYPEWRDNEIRKVYFAFALIKKGGFIFSIIEYRGGK